MGTLLPGTRGKLTQVHNRRNNFLENQDKMLSFKSLVLVALATVVTAHTGKTHHAHPHSNANPEGSFYRRQQCSNYQTTKMYNQKFIEKMTTLPKGWIMRMSNGALDTCQRLQFIDGNDFAISFFDVANYERSYTDRFTASEATATNPGKLHLSMYPRLWGSDIEGNLVLHPLVARDDIIAFTSCIERGLGLFITEQVLVFTPFTANKSLTDEEIMKILKEHQVPRLNEIKSVSTDCTKKATTAPNRLSLDLYNLISNFQNPMGGVSGVALTYGTAGQSQEAAGEQLMKLFNKYNISPAQFYAQTGSTVMHNSLRPQMTRFSGQEQQFGIVQKNRFDNQPFMFSPQTSQVNRFNKPSFLSQYEGQGTPLIPMMNLHHTHGQAAGLSFTPQRMSSFPSPSDVTFDITDNSGVSPSERSNFRRNPILKIFSTPSRTQV